MVFILGIYGVADLRYLHLTRRRRPIAIVPRVLTQMPYIMYKVCTRGAPGEEVDIWSSEDVSISKNWISELLTNSQNSTIDLARGK